ncbi:MAG: CbiX/SirB N-terminal domain-containing protein [Candidatus Brocadiales bacterium]
MVKIISVITILFLMGVTPLDAAQDEKGILVLAHGSKMALWNEQVRDAVRPLEGRYNVDIAFGMADPKTIQEAVNRLEKRGARSIVVVPLFVSSHSPIIYNTRRLLGLDPDNPQRQIEGNTDFVMTGALDDSPLVSEIVLERARELSEEPSAEVVVLVGYGPNEPELNVLWLANMQQIAGFVKEAGGFKDVMVQTVRDDAPREVWEAARRELRGKVKTAGADSRVLVIPFVLASGGIEEGIEGRLEGLRFEFGRPFLPHPSITKWIERQAAPHLR